MPVNPLETHPAAGAGDSLLLGFFDEPAGCLARTCPRQSLTGNCSAMASGTVYQQLLIIPAGTPITNITMVVGTTAKTGGTHGWYALADNNQRVLAVTADQTDAATTWGTINVPQGLPVTAPIVTAYTGVYYTCVMVAQSAGTNPLFKAPGAPAAGVANITGAPLLAGTSLTGQTTPPAVGSSLGTLTVNGGFFAYAYVS